MMMSHPHPKQGEAETEWRREEEEEEEEVMWACHSRPTTSRHVGEQGWAKGVGKDNPNKRLEDILPSAPKLITVPQWRWHLWEATHNMTGWTGLCFPLKTWANGQGLAVVDAHSRGGKGRWSNEWRDLRHRSAHWQTLQTACCTLFRQHSRGLPLR